MEFTLLSGVVRNRKVSQYTSEAPRPPDAQIGDEINNNNESGGSSSSTVTLSVGSNNPTTSTLSRIYSYVSGNAFIRNFSLRVHKFQFKWDLVLHLSVCLSSLMPFAFSGSRLFAIIPLSVWLFYNILFVIGTSRANSLVPGFGRFKHAFTASIEEFFSAKLLPVISVSFLLVVLLLTVTGKRLGGPPLCYSSCHVCLSKWSQSIPLSPQEAEMATALLLGTGLSRSSSSGAGGIDRSGCGYANGKELLSYYTIAQTSYLMFVTVLLSMAVCMAWRVAEEELTERQSAEEWLKREDPRAFAIRDEVMRRLGMPGSYIRPEGNALWVAFGVVGAMTFTLLGWHNWFLLPPSHTATLLIVLNLLTILTSMLILHLSFFGRLLALYQRNFMRVKALSSYLHSLEEYQLDAWWNCRNFILNDDLGLDYDTAGLAVSATFIIMVCNLVVLCAAVFQDGFRALMEPPGSYCGYACLYFTMCLIKIFTIATMTFEEQHKHIAGLHHINMSLLHRGTHGSSASLASLPFDYNTDHRIQQYVPSAAVAAALRHSDEHTAAATGGGGGIASYTNTPSATSTSSTVTGGVISDNYAHYLDTADMENEYAEDDGSGATATQPLLKRPMSFRLTTVNAGSSASASSSTANNSNSNNNGSPRPPLRVSGAGASASTLVPSLSQWMMSMGGGIAGNSDAQQEQQFQSTASNRGNVNNDVNMGNSSNSNTSISRSMSGIDVRQSSAGGGSNSNSGISGSEPLVSLSIDTTGISGNHSHYSSSNSLSRHHTHGHSSNSPTRHSHNNSSSGISVSVRRMSSLSVVTDDDSKNSDSTTQLSNSRPHSPSRSGSSSALVHSHISSSSSSSKNNSRPSSPRGAGGGGGLVRNSIGNMSFMRSSNHLYTSGAAGTSVNGSGGDSSGGHSGGGSGGYGLGLSSAAALEARRSTLAEMISQIRKYDPYPCILGIPVMPALFATSKLYIFICFAVIGLRVMVACFRELQML